MWWIYSSECNNVSPEVRRDLQITVTGVVSNCEPFDMGEGTKFGSPAWAGNALICWTISLALSPHDLWEHLDKWHWSWRVLQVHIQIYTIYSLFNLSHLQSIPQTSYSFFLIKGHLSKFTEVFWFYCLSNFHSLQ